MKPRQISSRPQSTDLLHELSKRSQSATKHELAQAAGVSVKTISEVLAGTYATSPRPSGDAKSARQRRGYVEALTRLSLFLSLDPEAVLQSYEIDPAWKGVQAAIERVRRKHSFENTQSDPVLDAIATRGDEVRYGLLIWPPFVRDNEALATSWASRYTRRLLGALNPLWKYDPVGVTTITEAIEGINKGQFDLVFGIYDTPYRRLRGLDFIHLPGIGVPLGALAPTKFELKWEDLLNENQRDRKRIRALVIEEEVGHLFLAGACGYTTPSNLTILREAGTESLAARFLKDFLQAKRLDERVVFVADRLTCERVSKKLTSTSTETWRETLPDGLNYEAEDLESAAYSTLLATGNSSDDGMQSTSARIGTDLVPSYRLGIAIRKDAPHWKALLNSSQVDELFRNSIHITANAYQELLEKEGRNLIPLHFGDIPDDLIQKFVSLLVNLEAWIETWTPFRGKLKKQLDQIQSLLARKEQPHESTS